MKKYLLFGVVAVSCWIVILFIDNISGDKIFPNKEVIDSAYFYHEFPDCIRQSYFITNLKSTRKYIRMFQERKLPFHDGSFMDSTDILLIDPYHLVYITELDTLPVDLVIGKGFQVPSGINERISGYFFMHNRNHDPPFNKIKICKTE